MRAPAFVAYLQAGELREAVRFPNPRGDGTLSVLLRPYGEGMKLVLSQDITERERNEAMRRDFVANVSHEIRTPLTVLAGFIETMAHLPLTEVERKRVLELMTQQTQRMQTLVSDLLTLAQLEGSPRPAADRWVAVARLLLRRWSPMPGAVGGRHRDRVQRRRGASSPAPSGAAQRGRNLLNNAVRYTPAGGRIDVSWRVRDDGSGELAVSDTGVGIAREHIPRLTERFYRVDGSRSRDTGGTGLGLSIVKHVVQRHGGETRHPERAGQGFALQAGLPGRSRARGPRGCRVVEPEQRRRGGRPEIAVRSCRSVGPLDAGQHLPASGTTWQARVSARRAGSRRVTARPA